jgi:DNA-binding MarR family transcriptional regulator
MSETTAILVSLPCMCATLRRASRALTQLYEDSLRPDGLRATQFTVLQVLSRVGEVSQGALGEILAMDSTTLTRTLKILGRNGWLAERRGKDHRTRLLRFTNAGRERFQRALPAWHRMQASLRRHLGRTRWNELVKHLDQITLHTMEGGLT